MLGLSSMSNRIINLLIGLSICLVVVHLIFTGNILTDAIARHVYLQLALPELLTAGIVGAGLCVASASLQVLLRNPLADPSILGLSSGASVVAGILLTTPLLAVMESPVVLVLACFVGALLSSVLLMGLSRRLSREHGQILLAGIAITTLASAALAWIYVLAPPQQSKTLTFWLLGSFAQSDWSQLFWVGGLVSVCSVRLLRHAHALNQLMVGESIAITHGVEVAKLRRECVVLCALIVGACVAISGSIAFVGLLVPHFVRRIWGADNRMVMPLSMAIGALFMGGVVVLNQALSIIALPVSLVTASIGAPVFVYVLLKHRVAG